MNGSSRYGTAQRHDGAIEIDCGPGCDTSVQFPVPVREINLEVGRGGLPPAEPRRGLHILCIDDDPHVLELMNDCLKHFGHQVKIAAGGKRGIELFRTARLKNQPYEVVITDLGMPDMDGLQVAQAIKTDSPVTPIIMMTGSGTLVHQDGETVPAVDAVVGKPPRMQDLNQLLLRLTLKG